MFKVEIKRTGDPIIKNFGNENLWYKYTYMTYQYIGDSIISRLTERITSIRSKPATLRAFGSTLKLDIDYGGNRMSLVGDIGKATANLTLEGSSMAAVQVRTMWNRTIEEMRPWIFSQLALIPKRALKDQFDVL